MFKTIEERVVLLEEKMEKLDKIQEDVEDIKVSLARIETVLKITQQQKQNNWDILKTILLITLGGGGAKLLEYFITHFRFIQ